MIETKTKFSASVRHRFVLGSVGLLLTGIVVTALFPQVAKSQAKSEAETGIQLLRAGKIDEAIPHLSKAVDLDSDALNSLRSRFGKRPQERLEKTFVELAIRPTNDNAFDEQGQIYTELEQYAKAESAYRKAIALSLGDFNPSYGTAYAAYGSLVPQYVELLLKLGKKSEAMNVLQRNCAVLLWNSEFESLCNRFKISKHAVVNEKTAGEIGEALNDIESNYTDEEQWLNAAKKADGLVKKYPWCTQALLMRAKINISKKPDIAIKDANRVLAKFPGQAEALYIRSQAHSTKLDYSSSLKDIDTALKQLPDCPTYWLERAEIQFNEGNWKQALADLDSGERVAAPNTDIAEKRAEILSCIGQREKALQALQARLRYVKLFDLDTAAALSHVRTLGLSDSFTVEQIKDEKIRLQIELGDLKEAEGAVDNALARKDPNFQYHLAKSRIFLHRHDNQRALEAASKGKDAESDGALASDESLIQRATVYDAMGESKLAKQDLQTALKIVEARLKEEKIPSDYFERAFLLARLGANRKNLLSDVSSAMKDNRTEVVDVGQFVSRISALKKPELTASVTAQVLKVHPKWGSLVKQWVD